MREVRLEELRQLLLSRGYKASDHRLAVDYGKVLDREMSLEKVEREETNQGRVRYTITYDPKLPALAPILTKNWRVMVQSDQRLYKAFPAPPPPMACLKRGSNLGDELEELRQLLVRARLSPRMGKVGTRAASGGRAVGFTCCKAGRRTCSLCPFTGAAENRKTVVTQVNIHHNNMVLPIRQNITCQDIYCLYILSCNKPGCMKQYSGLSTRPCYIRFSEHLASIRDPATTSPVGLHWQEPGHTLAHLTFLPVEKVGNRCPATLRQREKDLINRTGVLAAGLNTYR